ncbi:hypothetical protein [Paracoccus sp. SCSIO 75233]|uniref:hypothetical protein n=1 Tax=Paracoccus sp. SCSIO 75233 TaxID=3017782 RepID=UPI0022F07BA4|nr:hypothetical protein [Paracoccus sp. SCSIO 75233]WBU53920.1 hypothetical protein PAF12_03520 [Paracoccus sp. SCSIO 75233]
MGAHGGGALIAFNRDTWNSLETEAKALIIGEIPAALAELATGYVAEDELAISEAGDHGVTINPADPEVTALLAEYRKGEVERAIERAEERGADAARQLSEAYLENLAKWEKISNEVGMDKALIEEALNREIYSKLEM